MPVSLHRHVVPSCQRHPRQSRPRPVSTCRAQQRPVIRATQRDLPKHTSTAHWLSNAAAIALAWSIAGPAAAYQLEVTEGNFNVKCIGCHAGGGNVLAVGASLFPDDLKRNGFSEPQALYDIIYKGKGKMPGFGKECAPRGQCTFGPRLTDEEIQDLAEYVLAKADAGWK